MDRSGRIIFGGSFNPIHAGHMRIAINSLRMLRDRVGTLEFLPSAHPPHKPCMPMLPFALRVKLIEAAISGFPNMTCNSLEGERSGFSYTFDTVSLLGEKYGAENLYFLIGSQDFHLLAEWHRGLELARICNLVVAPRGMYSPEDFSVECGNFWELASPSARLSATKCMDERVYSIKVKGGYVVYYLQMPLLEISSTYLRRLWLCSGSLAFLVPERSLEILIQERQAVDCCWQEKKC